MVANPQHMLLSLPTPRPGLHTAWDPSVKSAGITLSNNNRTAAANAVNFSGVNATNGKPRASGGKFYWEIATNGVYSDNRSVVGFCDDNHTITNFPNGSHMGNLTEPGTHMETSGFGGITTSLGDFNNRVIGIALDLPNSAWWASYNGVLWNAGAGADPATGVGGQSFSGVPTLGGTSGLIFIFAGIIDTGATMILNCGNEAGGFARSVPSGFTPWDT